MKGEKLNVWGNRVVNSKSTFQNKVWLLKNYIVQSLNGFKTKNLPGWMSDSRMSVWNEDEFCAVAVAAFDPFQEGVFDVNQSGLLFIQFLSKENSTRWKFVYVTCCFSFFWGWIFLRINHSTNSLIFYLFKKLVSFHFLKFPGLEKVRNHFYLVGR